MPARQIVKTLILVAMTVMTVWAQDPPPGTKWKLEKIEFEGLNTRKQEEVVPVTGLTIGQTVDLDAIKAASRNLGTSGLFKQVAFRYRYGGDRVQVTFEVEEAKAERFNCIFDNFVWFSDQEINEAVVKELPDFDGTAPQGDFVTAKIKQALSSLLKSKNLPGEVIHDVNENLSGGRPDLIFKVKVRDLKVCSIQFDGANADIRPPLLKESQPLLQAEYSRMDAGLFFRSALTPIYLNRGYLKARFQRVQAQLGSSGDCQKGVAITLPVEEGPQYRWDKAVWSGNQAIQSQELDAMLGMKFGAVAGDDKIRKGLSEVSSAYAEKGYMAMRVKPSQAFDDAQQRVTYQVSIEEGPQYRMGELIVKGLPETEAKKLRDRWKPKEGDVYDGIAVSESVMRATRDGVLPAKQSGREVTFQPKPDHQKLTVDVEIQVK